MVYYLYRLTYLLEHSLMTTVPCPLCHSDVIVDDDAYEKDLVTCTNCECDLEITSMTPLELKAIEDEVIENEEDPEVEKLKE